MGNDTMHVLTVPDRRLTLRSKTVELFDDRLVDVIEKMTWTMRASSGIGLAAPQVGVMDRVVIIDVSCGVGDYRPMALVNPEVTWRSSDTVLDREGCLSMPGVVCDVTRSRSLSVVYCDRVGRPKEFSALGLVARVIQHEIDHLDGVMMTDRAVTPQ